MLVLKPKKFIGIGEASLEKMKGMFQGECYRGEDSSGD